MKNKYGFLLLALALFSQSAYASVGVTKDRTITTGGTVSASAVQATDIDFDGGVTVTTDGSVVKVDPTTTTENYTFQSSVVASGRVGASTQVASSSTNLAPTSLPYGVVFKNVGCANDSADGGTRLPNGVAGQMITFQISSLCTGATWTLTPLTKTGFTSISFDTKGDLLTLLYVNSTIGWIVVQNSGAVVTQTTFISGPAT